MKALSIVFPGGSKIASGEKILEIRSWKPELSPEDDLLIVENNKFLRNEEDTDLGKVVAVVRVKRVREYLESDIPAACGSRWEPGYFAWELDKVRSVKSKENVLAARGIYEIEFEHGDAQSTLRGGLEPPPCG